MNPQDNQALFPGDLIQRLSSGIKMDFEVKRMDPSLRTRKTMTGSVPAMPATT